jgi:cytochrome c-type biogenesis protein
MDPGLLALALLAGAVAAFNPCGFALLPAYLGLLVAAPDEGRSTAVRRAVRFATGMTVGFVAVFGLVGAVVAPVAAALQRYLPVLTVLIGAVLMVLGVRLLAGRGLALPGLAGRGRPPTESWASQLVFGVSFALASLSCTLAPFLAVTAGSLRAAGPLGVVGTFLVYALGMGTVVLVLSLAVALARGSLVRSMRRAGAVLSRGSGALLLVAGAYVAWYGWFEIRVLTGTAVSDPVISAAVSVQAALTRWVTGLGAVGVLVLAGTAAAVVLLLRRSRAPQAQEPAR